MTYNISLIEFLKTYTAISNKFIDSYYRFYEMCKTNKFGIEASKVIKYLGLTYPKKFYERLRTNFIINSDYIIKKKNQKLLNGEKILYVIN